MLPIIMAAVGKFQEGAKQSAANDYAESQAPVLAREQAEKDRQAILQRRAGNKSPAGGAGSVDIANLINGVFTSKNARDTTSGTDWGKYV
jgi:hypothetical protein